MNAPAVNLQLGDQLKAFNELWKGGYYEGNPLDPMGASNYNKLGYMSVLHATYLACIKPYVNPDSIVLEIGPGRGGWTKAILAKHPREVWCLDAVSAETAHFWEYVGCHLNVHFQQVTDFTCSNLPDDHFTYFFSFGCFCHVPNEGVDAYVRNLHQKFRPGAHGFMMVGDFSKYNRAIDNLQMYEAERACHGRRYLPAKLLWKLIGSLSRPDNLKHKVQSKRMHPDRITWHNLSTQDACSMLEAAGYEVIDPDMEINHRDPVIHFVRP